MPAASLPLPVVNRNAAVRWLWFSFVFSVLAFAWLRFSENTADNDLWGHVLYGQRAFHLGHVECVDHLSWTAAGRPWINHEVLAELVLGLAHRVAGSTGLWLLMVGLAVLTLGWAWRAGAGADRSRWFTALALLAVCVNFIALGYAVRPQLFTFLAFVILLTALRRCFAGRLAWGVLPPLLLVAWVNAHGGFLAGWLVVVLAMGAESVGRLQPALLRRMRCAPVAIGQPMMGAIAIGSTLALALNPWGWKLVFWTIGTLRLPRPAITEWQPMAVSFSTVPFYFVIGLGLVAWAVSRQPRRLWEISVWTLLAAMAAAHQRHAPLFGLAMLMFLPVHLHDLGSRLAPATAGLRTALQRPAVAAGLVCALFLGGGWCLKSSASRPFPFRMEVPRDLFPVAAIEFMREHRLTGNTLTFFDWGQQVLWELPDNPVSFDGRLDTVYPAEIMNAHWRLYAGQEPGPALDLTQARYALLPTGSAGITLLLHRGWTLAYTDPLATVLSRAPLAIPPQRGGHDAVTGAAPFPDDPPVLAMRVAAK